MLPKDELLMHITECIEKDQIFDFANRRRLPKRRKTNNSTIKFYDQFWDDFTFGEDQNNVYLHAVSKGAIHVVQQLDSLDDRCKHSYNKQQASCLQIALENKQNVLIEYFLSQDKNCSVLFRLVNNLFTKTHPIDFDLLLPFVPDVFENNWFILVLFIKHELKTKDKWKTGENFCRVVAQKWQIEHLDAFVEQLQISICGRISLKLDETEWIGICAVAAKYGEMNVIRHIPSCYYFQKTFLNPGFNDGWQIFFIAIEHDHFDVVKHMCNDSIILNYKTTPCQLCLDPIQFALFHNKKRILWWMLTQEIFQKMMNNWWTHSMWHKYDWLSIPFLHYLEQQSIKIHYSVLIVNFIRSQYLAGIDFILSKKPQYKRGILFTAVLVGSVEVVRFIMAKIENTCDWKKCLTVRKQLKDWWYERTTIRNHQNFRRQNHFFVTLHDANLFELSIYCREFVIFKLFLQKLDIDILQNYDFDLPQFLQNGNLAFFEFFMLQGVRPKCISQNNLNELYQVLFLQNWSKYFEKLLASHLPFFIANLNSDIVGFLQTWDDMILFYQVPNN